MNEGQLLKCRECTYVTFDLDAFAAHSREHGKWSAPMVKTLIMLYMDNRHKFGSMNWTTKKVWYNISAAMRSLGYQVNAHQCSEKWRNLKKSYIKIRDTADENRRKQWEFFTEMEGALGEIPMESALEPQFSINYISEREPVIKQEGVLETSVPHPRNNSNFQMEMDGAMDQSPVPRTPSPPAMSYSREFNEDNLSRHKMPPREWYDEYLEELRAARQDKNRRHREKQMFRQQILDLCKQLIINSGSNRRN